MNISKTKNYKALMLDIDGTTVPNGRTGKPSQAVIDAVKKAHDLIHISFATARRYAHTLHIAKALDLKSPSVVSGGAEIRDMKTGQIIWSKFIPTAIAREIIDPLRNKFEIWIDDNNYYLENIVYKAENSPVDPLQISIVDVPIGDSDLYLKQLRKYKELAVHKTVSWTNPEVVWLSITHNEASKQHGIFEVAKLLGIETHEIIGVGDGYNDFPLLMACGLRVAMGNAVPELKEIADYIAPPVEQDGVAHIINKFIIK